jgi:hypothetical protein
MNNNKTVYLIGNGPSLNKVDVTQLKDKNTISFNRAFIAFEDWGFDPTHYMVIDPVVMENTQEDVNRLIRESEIQSFFFRKRFNHFISESSEKINLVDFKQRFWERGYKWGKNLNNMGVIANVGATAVPILRSLGYERVVILGTDCNYEEQDIKGVSIVENEGNADRRIVYKSDGDNDPNHFRPDYFGKGTEYSKPQTQNHYKGWEYISQKHKANGLEVLLCSPGSRLSNIFEEISFEEAIAKY